MAANLWLARKRFQGAGRNGGASYLGAGKSEMEGCGDQVLETWAWQGAWWDELRRTGARLRREVPRFWTIWNPRVYVCGIPQRIGIVIIDSRWGFDKVSVSHRGAV